MIVGAILEMIQHLQRAAQRIDGRPGVVALAMEIEELPPDRRGRVAAVMHQIGPIRRSAAWSRPCGRREGCRGNAGRSCRSRAGSRACATAAGESSPGAPSSTASMRSSRRTFSSADERGIVGDIVGSAREAIEGMDMHAQIAANEERADGKILVALALARRRLDRQRLCHCTRPFHSPPRPRQCRHADAIVAPRYTEAAAGSNGAQSSERP